MNWIQWLKHYLLGHEYITFKFAGDTEVKKVCVLPTGDRYVKSYGSIFILDDSEMEMTDSSDKYRTKSYMYLAKLDPVEKEPELKPNGDIKYIMECLDKTLDERNDAHVNDIWAVRDVLENIYRDDRQREETD